MAKEAVKSRWAGAAFAASGLTLISGVKAARPWSCLVPRCELLRDCDSLCAFGARDPAARALVDGTSIFICLLLRRGSGSSGARPSSPSLSLKRRHTSTRAYVHLTIFWSGLASLGLSARAGWYWGDRVSHNRQSIASTRTQDRLQYTHSEPRLCATRRSALVVATTLSGRLVLVQLSAFCRKELQHSTQREQQLLARTFTRITCLEAVVLCLGHKEIQGIG
jgi:hypothetical protein